MPGQNGVVINAIAGINLAMWDLVGKIKGEPVYNLIGGKVRDKLHTYVTGVQPKMYKEWGHFGAKYPLPYGPDHRVEDILLQNVPILCTF